MRCKVCRKRMETDAEYVQVNSITKKDNTTRAHGNYIYYPERIVNMHMGCWDVIEQVIIKKHVQDSK